MEINGVHFPMAQIANLATEFGVVRLSLFGSILRDDFRPDSDVDMLVQFGPGVRIGLLGVAKLGAALSDAIGRQVDLRTADDLSQDFRGHVVRQATLLQAA